MLRQLLVTSTAALVVVVASAVAAGAHVAADPSEVPAGTTQTIGFTVEHGCGESPTVGVDVQLPDGVRGVPEPTPGWEASVAGDVVSWSGGPLDHDTPLRFALTLTLPDRPGEIVYFPLVQRCEQGEIRWIGIPPPGSEVEPEDPAPAVSLVAGAGPTTTAAPVAPTTTVAPASPAGSAVTDTTAPDTTAPEVTAASTTSRAGAETTDGPSPSQAAVAAAEDSGDDGGSGGLLALALVPVAVAAAAGFILLRQRRRAG